MLTNSCDAARDGVGRSAEFAHAGALGRISRSQPFAPLVSTATLLRGHPMLMRNISPFPTRRFAAGIDVSPHEVRLLIASRARREKWPVGVEWMGAVPLAAGAVCGERVVDRAAVTAAIALLCARAPRCSTMRGMSFAMAVPGETEAGAATACNSHLEACVEAAAAAGIALATVDNERQAALRALVYAAERTLGPSPRFAALWAGRSGIHGWRVADGEVRASLRFPGGEHADLASSLRILAGKEGLERALVGGDCAVLERVGLALADIGECLGCTVAPFESRSFRAKGASLCTCADWRRDAEFAVAFGLALRGVCE